jgi:hypothetical protein
MEGNPNQQFIPSPSQPPQQPQPGFNQFTDWGMGFGRIPQQPSFFNPYMGNYNPYPQFGGFGGFGGGFGGFGGGFDGFNPMMGGPAQQQGGASSGGSLFSPLTSTQPTTPYNDFVAKINETDEQRRIRVNNATFGGTQYFGGDSPPRDSPLPPGFQPMLGGIMGGGAQQRAAQMGGEMGNYNPYPQFGGFGGFGGGFGGFNPIMGGIGQFGGFGRMNYGWGGPQNFHARENKMRPAVMPLPELLRGQ